MKLDRSQKIIICFTLIFAFVLAVHSTSLPVKEDAGFKRCRPPYDRGTSRR